MLALLALAWMGTATAQDCDAKALAKEVEEATPVSLPAAFEKLVACDEKAATEASEKVIARLLPDDAGFGAIVTAIDLGKGDQVRTWLEGLQSDERSKGVAYLGKACAENEKVGEWFVVSAVTMGDAFWVERYHRGLAGCHTDGIRKMLGDEVEAQKKGGDRSRFFSVLEVYARNMRGDALDTLVTLAREVESEEDQTYVMSAFGDAVGVGSMEGVDPDVAGRAVRSITELAPELEPRAVEQARTILISLEAERPADQLAKHRWPSAYRFGQDRYRYTVVAVEEIACKNGSKLGYLHYADFSEGGNLWPEQVAELIPEKVKFEWALEEKAPCGGERTLTFQLPNEPFASDADASAFLEDQRTKFLKKTVGFKKTAEKPHAAFEL